MLAQAAILSFISIAAAFPATDYGYWDVNITSYNAASGYKGGDIYAEYSGTPGRIAHSTWLYRPEYRNTTITTDDPTFIVTQVNYSGNQCECQLVESVSTFS